MGVDLTGVRLMGVHLNGVHLTGVCLVGVYLTGVHLVHLTEHASQAVVLWCPRMVPLVFNIGALETTRNLRLCGFSAYWVLGFAVPHISLVQYALGGAVSHTLSRSVYSCLRPLVTPVFCCRSLAHPFCCHYHCQECCE